MFRSVLAFYRTLLHEAISIRSQSVLSHIGPTESCFIWAPSHLGPRKKDLIWVPLSFSRDIFTEEKRHLNGQRKNVNI